MIGQLLAKVVGTQNEREIKRIRPRVADINALEASIRALSDEQLREKTGEFKARLAGGASLDDLLPEAFAAVREAGRRVLNMRHFDVQLIGGMVLHSGAIAEMRTLLPEAEVHASRDVSSGEEHDGPTPVRPEAALPAEQEGGGGF